MSDDFEPTTAAELARFVADNAQTARRPLNPVGGRTALHVGYPLPEDALSVDINALDRVIDYPARDMTITVEAGIRVAELQRVLAAEHQRIAVDVAQAHRATIGGALATNTSGPGRYSNGTFRDYVIGISAVDGSGRLFSAGGRVVKNVAGYDLCKLLVGSLGTLAVITQVTLKLRPEPETRQLVWCTFPDLASVDAAVEALLQSATRPTAIDVLTAKAARQVRSEAKHDLPAEKPVLCLAYEGTERESRWQVGQVSTELTRQGVVEQRVLHDAAAQETWSALVEYQAASDDPLTFQASLPASQLAGLLNLAESAGIAVQAHAASGVTIGHFPDSCTRADDAIALLAPLRDHAERHGGSLVVWNCDAAWKASLSLFGARRSESKIDEGIRTALDPRRLLNPGLLGAGREPAKR